MAKELRVGIIGCGAIAMRLHVPDIYYGKSGTLVAFCDTRKQRAQALAAQYAPDAAIYTDHKTMLADGVCDAVIVCLPNALHAPITVDACKAGCHVFVEKPMAQSLKECDQMITAAKKAGVLLMVDQVQRLQPQNRKAKEIIDSGILGRIEHVKAMFGHSGPDNWAPWAKWFFKKDEARFGAMADLGVHKADLIRWLTGQEVKQICGFYEKYERPSSTVEDNFVSALQFADGAVGTLSASWTVRGQMNDYVIIHGSKGTMKVGVFPDTPVYVELGSPRGVMAYTPADLDYPPYTYDESWRCDAGGAFCRACLGEEPPFCTGEDARRSLEVILAAEKAADTGKTVTIKH